MPAVKRFYDRDQVVFSWPRNEMIDKPSEGMLMTRFMPRMILYPGSDKPAAENESECGAVTPQKPGHCEGA